jgi:coenzyme F420-0:L-glutamate ligase/coenzyme F420-1:gamma-L-glutamate ligase
MVITRHKLGFQVSSSGVDMSNVAPLSDRLVVLLPKDPDQSARLVRNKISELTGKKVAVIFNDSLGKEDRDGSIGTAIGIAGISHLEIHKKKDLFGNDSFCRIALIDEMAAAGSMLMAQSDESIPVVIIRGISYTEKEDVKIQDILNL